MLFFKGSTMKQYILIILSLTLPNHLLAMWCPSLLDLTPRERAHKILSYFGSDKDHEAYNRLLNELRLESKDENEFLQKKAKIDQLRAQMQRDADRTLFGERSVRQKLPLPPEFFEDLIVNNKNNKKLCS